MVAVDTRISPEPTTFRRRHHATVNALWIGIQFQEAALMAIIVPAIVLVMAPRDHTPVLAMLATVSSSCSTLIPPVVGALSDRGRRHGVSDRRVETAVMLAVDALALFAIAFAPNTLMLAIAIGISATAISAASTVYQALLPEVVPRHAWGISSGFRGALTLLGTVIGLLVAALLAPKWALYTTATIVALGAVTLALIPNAKGDEKPDAPACIADRHDLIVTLFARAFMVLGMGLLNTYILYFFHDVLHVANAPMRTGITASGALGGAIVASIIAGIVSDRVDRRMVFVLSGVPMVIAGFGFAFAPTPGALIGYAALFGIGFGGIFSVGWALALDAIPEMGDVGRDLGVWSTLSGLPSIIAPAFGAWMIALGGTPRDGYRIMFAVATACFALGALTVLFVRKRPPAVSLAAGRGNAAR
ncbi:MAG TPA: MFS transporter [Candidatus Baltobacteraceae bacterium]|nr:MFS transporter [Candidatus Baltobacteraceae bacterium]